MTDIRVVQKVARQALLIEAGQDEPDQGIKEIAEADTKENEEIKWQKELTSILQNLIIEEHQTKMRLGEEKEIPGPVTSADSRESLWLSSPPPLLTAVVSLRLLWSLCEPDIWNQQHLSCSSQSCLTDIDGHFSSDHHI